ncbi:hypothetical protein DFH09DRAFT_939921 [Mycena vulgaris]|nr:hypothetical protein DFH09DRAFT_939921 [Mycena vulgaris]
MKLTTAVFALIPLVHAIPTPEPDAVIATFVVLYSSTQLIFSPGCACRPHLRQRVYRASRCKFNAHVDCPSLVCHDAGFAGGCKVFHGASGQCVNVPASFNDNISAVGPDSGQDCFFFMQVLLKS